MRRTSIDDAVIDLYRLFGLGDLNRFRDPPSCR